MKDLHAYNYFSVGNAGSSNCYTPHHHQFETAGDASSGVKSDDISVANDGLSDACKPLFWVGGKDGKAVGNGNVYVATDLNIGGIGTDNKHNEALKLTAEGVIRQKDGLTIDKDGRIITRETVSADVGDLKSGEHFVLDPAYTSTMNDIRLASRGGVRLSDILPTYILKEQFDVICSISGGHGTSRMKGTTNGTSTVNTDLTWCDGAKASGGSTLLSFSESCPTGYQKAVVVIPSYVGALKEPVVKKDHTHDFQTGNARKTDDSEDIKFITSSTDTTGTQHIHKGTTSKAKVSAVETQFISDIEECQFFVAVSPEDSDKHQYAVTKITDKFYVTMGYRSREASAKIDGKNYNYLCPNLSTDSETLHATVQTYCVWEPSMLGSEAKCNAAGYTWTSGACTGTRRIALMADGLAVKGTERDQYLCKAAGFEWVAATSTVPAHCQYKYITASQVNSLTKITTGTGDGTIFNEDDAALLKRKAAVCKAAGYKWNGTTCSDS